VAKKRPLLEQMRGNPRADWNIKDVENVCNEHNIKLMPPTRGDHYKAASPYIAGHQTIPARRPIKPVYIKALVSMIELHIELAEQSERKR
jgi:hypothetical protein